MKKILTYIALAAVVMLCLSSCSKKGKVIPRGTMSEIYADIFIADDAEVRAGNIDHQLSADLLLGKLHGVKHRLDRIMEIAENLKK